MIYEDFTMEGTKLVEYLGVGPDVMVPDGVTAIDSSVFEDDPYIRTVRLPSSLKVIGECAFWGSHLERVYIPGSVQVIDHGVFCNCKRLQEVVIDQGVKEIGESAFSGCDQLSCIHIPDTLEKVYHDAFVDCVGLKEIVASKDWMLTHRHLLHRILKSAPMKVRSQYVRNHSDFQIDLGVLVEYQGNHSHVVIPEGVKIIGADAFRNCRYVKEVLLPPNILEIGESAFKGCENLTKINLPDTLVKIEGNAFEDCPKLNHIDFPGGLKKIGYSAFHDGSLISVTVPGNVKTIEPFSFSLAWRMKEIVLENGVEQIHRYAFSNIRYPVALTIPDSVKYIHKEAFRNTRFSKVNASENWKKTNPDLWEILNR